MSLAVVAPSDECV